MFTVSRCGGILAGVNKRKQDLRQIRDNFWWVFEAQMNRLWWRALAGGVDEKPWRLAEYW